MGMSKKKTRYRVREEMWKAQGKRCFYCRKLITLEEATFDHRIPVAKGGKDGQYNMVIACERCNKQKATSIWERPIVTVKVTGRVTTDKLADDWMADFKVWLAGRGEAFVGVYHVADAQFKIIAKPGDWVREAHPTLTGGRCGIVNDPPLSPTGRVRVTVHGLFDADVWVPFDQRPRRTFAAERCRRMTAQEVGRAQGLDNQRLEAE